jgi:hypothetical protein
MRKHVCEARETFKKQQFMVKSVQNHVHDTHEHLQTLVIVVEGQADQLDQAKRNLQQVEERARDCKKHLQKIVQEKVERLLKVFPVGRSTDQKRGDYNWIVDNLLSSDGNFASGNIHWDDVVENANQIMGNITQIMIALSIYLNVSLYFPMQIGHGSGSESSSDTSSAVSSSSRDRSKTAPDKHESGYKQSRNVNVANSSSTSKIDPRQGGSLVSLSSTSSSNPMRDPTVATAHASRQKHKQQFYVVKSRCCLHVQEESSDGMSEDDDDMQDVTASYSIIDLKEMDQKCASKWTSYFSPICLQSPLCSLPRNIPFENRERSFFKVSSSEVNVWGKSSHIQSAIWKIHFNILHLCWHKGVREVHPHCPLSNLIILLDAIRGKRSHNQVTSSLGLRSSFLSHRKNRFDLFLFEYAVVVSTSSWTRFDQFI